MQLYTNKMDEHNLNHNTSTLNEDKYKYVLKSIKMDMEKGKRLLV